MTEVLCAAIECKHNESGSCEKERIGLSSHFVQTVWQGRQTYWKCTDFEESERYKEIKKIWEELSEKNCR